MNCKISIILPAYNSASTVSKSIQSVLDQTYADWELLIIDDGSSDGTQRVVATFITKDNRIRCIKNEENLGIQRSLNRGISEAKGAYIARIDSDDVWIDRDKLKEQVVFLEQYSQYVLVGTGAVLVDISGKEIVKYLLPEKDEVIRKRMLGKNCFVHSAVLMRTDVVRRIGGYKESVSVRHVEDHDLWLRLGQHGKMKNLSMYAVQLTISRSSITARHRVLQAKRMLLLSVKNKSFYPNLMVGIIIGVVRLLFFVFQSIIPISNKLIYTIQKKIRQS